jgi:hypothetical protein
MDIFADSIAALSLLVAVGSFFYQQQRLRALEKKQEARQSPEIELKSDPLFQRDHPNWLDRNAPDMTLRIRDAGQDRATHICVALLGCETYIVPDTLPQRRMDGMNGLYWAGEVSLPHRYRVLRMCPALSCSLFAACSLVPTFAGLLLGLLPYPG